MIRSSNSGFSLLEIMIVVAIIGIMTATITRVMVKKPVDTWQTLLENMTIMLAQAQQQALLTQKVHRLTIVAPSKGGGKITLEIEEKNPEKPTMMIYTKSSDTRVENPLVIPQIFQVRTIYVNGSSVLNDKSSTASIYITKEGMIQPAIFHIARGTNSKGESKKSFILQPFLGRFEIQDGFIKP